MKKRIEKVSVWEDDLIWCPSQCYLKMEFEDRYFMLYLRWRHSDPWDATLIECDSDYDMHSRKYQWIGLEVEYWKDTQISEVKKNAIKVAEETISDLQKTDKT